ncbi:unnamed protein product [Prunus armeniaca]
MGKRFDVSKWDQHQFNVGNITGFVPGSEEFGAGPINLLGEPIPPPPPLPPPPSAPHPPVGVGAGESELDLRHVLDQFTRTVTTALQGRRNTEASDIKRVKELGAHEFFGSYPVEAENSLTNIERTVRRGLTNPSVVTWAEFQHVFYEQLYPHSYQNAKKSEFLHLKQGLMSVLEYEHKFNGLSWFALELIPTEEEKCRRFEEGLWLDIQAVVTATTYPTMRTLAQIADRMAKKLSAGRIWAVDGPEDVGPILVVEDLGVSQLGVRHFRRDCPRLRKSVVQVRGAVRETRQFRLEPEWCFIISCGLFIQ